MNEELAITVGAAARAARVRLGLTQADVAERVGIAMEVYSRMERGKVLPSVTTLRRLCQVLRIGADTLLGLEVEGLDAPLEEGVAEPAPGEDPPRLRRLVRALRALDPPQLKAVSQVVHGALGLLRR
ncbi:helix-turn-helix transcriptional regulator [Pyxidicoccus fallax]|uniref:Helix-turn-helix transcriptional regulator n=1 Tax=Pyxidicoccus fallax TaxID=394095 RepID=A0A848LYW3_9BACT|nr:helix-turn-helix transcriptional regulator [Pyxidicoccus fallax]NMO22790.1 helix-turn-helix transcriptional regulator [Pyxidicoccus fallax]NPC85389.1 helix-turn-helix transcriptional regulator [Pyxidicoccus fallax]